MPQRAFEHHRLLPGVRTPAVGPEQPLEMLAACHERAQRTLDLLHTLQAHVRSKGCDAAAQDASRDVMRYFDLAAPLHHQDEELHVFPPLLALGDATLRALVLRLQDEHRQMDRAWTQARAVMAQLAEGLVGSAQQTLLPEQESTLQAFADLYARHLQDEDNMVYPSAGTALTPVQLQAMSADMVQRRSPPQHASLRQAAACQLHLTAIWRTVFLPVHHCYAAG